MISDLRLPSAAKSGIAAAAILVSLFLFTLPPSGHDRPTMGGLAAEALIVFGTLALGAIAPLMAVVHVARPRPSLAAAYSWIALAVLVGNAALLMLGYWHMASEVDWAHYAFAPALVAVSVIALVPTLIAQAVHVVGSLRRRA